MLLTIPRGDNVSSALEKAFAKMTRRLDCVRKSCPVAARNVDARFFANNRLDTSLVHSGEIRVTHFIHSRLKKCAFLFVYEIFHPSPRAL